jgi:hypothetical protein
MHLVKWLAPLTLALADAAPTLGPAAASAAPAAQAMAKVRVVHASPDAPAVDVLVDGARAISNLGYGEAIGYVDLPAGAHAVAVVPAGADADAAVIDASLDLQGSTAYTVMAVGRLAEIAPLVLVDDLTAPMGSDARVRFVHTAADAPAVDVAVVDGPTLFSNMAFKDASQYLTAPAGTVDLAVRVAGTDTTVLTVPGVTLDAGKVYTIAAVGLASGQPTLAALPLSDY